MKKILPSILMGILLISGIFVPSASSQEKRSDILTSQKDISLKGFINDVIQAVSYRAADMGYDYSRRQAVGVLVADFPNLSGEEIGLGNDIGADLRAALNRGKQFHVYGKDHPVSLQLKTALAADPQWSGASQRRFQQLLKEKFNSFPVDLVIAGLVGKETSGDGEIITCSVLLSPFMETITSVEGESGRKDLVLQKFVSPVFPGEVLAQHFSPRKVSDVPKGRLVILSLIRVDRGRAGGPESRVVEDSSIKKGGGLLAEKSWRIASLKEISCWLDGQPLASLQSWPEDKKKNYYNFLSGVNADTIWFDDLVAEGPHSFFVSLVKGSMKNQYQTFSKTLAIKGGQSSYLYFNLLTDAYGEPQLHLEQIVDPENRPLPF